MVVQIILFIWLCVHLLLGALLGERVLDIPIFIILGEKPNPWLKFLAFFLWIITVPIYAVVGVVFWIVYTNKK